MKTPSEMLRTLVGSMKPTVGNYIHRKLLEEIAAEAENIERELDDLNEEIRCRREGVD